MTGSTARRLAAAAVALAIGSVEGSAAARRDRPRLGVVIVVDGLGEAALERWRPWFHSGLARLLEEGFQSTACRYAHSSTSTAPGHASIATGAPPRVNGIVGNRWYEHEADGSLREVVAAEEVDRAPGSKQLEVPTLADRLRELYPDTRVVSLSGKDRSAALLAGRDPRHAVAWFDGERGRFVTSAQAGPASADRAALSRLLDRFARESGDALVARYGTTWSRLPLGPAPPASGGTPSLEPYQNPVIGVGFDHALDAAGTRYAEAFQESPFQDAFLTDLAVAFLQDDALALGRRDGADLLLLSYSAHDYIAHAYGSESTEALESLRHLDLELGRLLDAIDGRVPRTESLVALSADHGFTPLPEVARREDPKSKAARMPVKTLVGAIGDLVARDACVDPAQGPFVEFEGWGLYLAPAGLNGKAGRRPCAPGEADLPVKPQDLPRRIERAIPGVFRDAAYLAPGPVDPATRELQRNATFPGRSPDLFLVPLPGVIPDHGTGKGATHQTPYDCDRRVPLVLRGGAFRHSRSDRATTPYDIAPTIAAWLGIRLPDATGRDLAAVDTAKRDPSRPAR